MAPRGDRDPDDAIDFVVQLGSAMLAASSPATEVRQRIELVAIAYDLELEFFVLPTGVWAVGYEKAVLVSLSAVDPGTYRFDQIKALLRLVDQAAAGGVPPDEGLTALAEIRSMEPQFGRWLQVLGFVFVAFGIALVVRGTWRDLAAATVLGGVSGVLMSLTPNRPAFENLLPALASFVVGLAAFSMLEAGWIDDSIRVLTPALVIFLPGAMLTIGAIELSDGSLASGSSRMVAGFYQLLLLAFGLVVAGSVVGLSSADEVIDPAIDGVGWWASWIGVGVYVVGVGLAFSAPRDSWPSLFLVSYVAWAAQSLVTPHVVEHLSAMVGATAALLAACFAARRLGGPTPLLSFTPAFWLLVPGGLGLLGVTRATAGSTGGAEIGVALFTIVGIALGVIIGLAADRFLRAHTRWW